MEKFFQLASRRSRHGKFFSWRRGVRGTENFSAVVASFEARKIFKRASRRSRHGKFLSGRRVVRGMGNFSAGGSAFTARKFFSGRLGVRGLEIFQRSARRPRRGKIFQRTARRSRHGKIFQRSARRSRHGKFFSWRLVVHGTENFSADGAAFGAGEIFCARRFS